MQCGKIFDTFLFDSELTLLEHRFAETFDVVDTYVIVEAGETFQGKPKPLTFSDNRDRFSKYASKIVHIALPSLGSLHANDPRAAWERERIQRNAVLFGLRQASADDILLLLDADEIPSREFLQRLRAEGLDIPRRLLMTRHYEAADLLAPRSPCCPSTSEPFPFALGRKLPQRWDRLAIDWFSRSGVALPVAALAGAASAKWLNPFDVRRTTPVAGAIPDAGRHLCFVDPSARPSRKLGRGAHAELAVASARSGAHLSRCTRYAVHHRGWWYAERPSGELPPDLERLRHRSAEIRCGERLPPALFRRLVRTWTRLLSLHAVSQARAIAAHLNPARN